MEKTKIFTTVHRAAFLSVPLTGLLLISAPSHAACTTGSEATCDTSASLKGGTYNTVVLDNSATHATLSLDGVTVAGEGLLEDGEGYIYGGSGANTLVLRDSQAAEVVGGGSGSVIDIYSGRYQRVLGGRGDSVVNIHGDSADIGSLSGDFFNDPAGAAPVAQDHDVLNLLTVTDAIAKSPLAESGETVSLSNNLQGLAAGYGFEEINLLDHSNLTLRNDLWNAAVVNDPQLSIDATSQLNVMGSRTINGSLSNRGTVNLNDGSVANQLHVTGDWNGDNGTLVLGTVLAGGKQATDKLVVDNNTSGTTNVRIVNVGGKGAPLTKGLEVVQVGGQSAGEFVQQGRITAGAYDYTLARGAGANAGNWYLSSGDSAQNNNVRPEAAAYGVNIAAANTLFASTLHDRLGETHYVDAQGQQQVTSLWLRNVGGHNRSTDSSEQNKTQANRYVVQLGGDIASWTNSGEDRWHLGVMGGYANQQGNTRNTHTGYSADSRIDGYSAGLYASWFQDNQEKTGAYVDSWMLYNWFNNTVSGEGSASSEYKSKGITASLETGYAWKLAEFSKRNAWYIQPQAQITYMGVSADDYREANGTRVTSEGDGNIQSRLGVRTYLRGHSAADDTTGRTFEPFVEANWLHNTENFGASLDGTRIDQAGARNIAELKTGVEAKLSQNVNLWGNVAQQIGDKGYSDLQGMLGVKVTF